MELEVAKMEKALTNHMDDVRVDEINRWWIQLQMAASLGILFSWVRRSWSVRCPFNEVQALH